MPYTAPKEIMLIAQEFTVRHMFPTSIAIKEITKDKANFLSIWYIFVAKLINRRNMATISIVRMLP